MKPTYLPCKKADVLQAYCCLRQVDAAFNFAHFRQREIQDFVKAYLSYYTIPPFSDTNYLEGDGLTAESDQVFEEIQRQGKQYHTQIKQAIRSNKYRPDTYLINTLTLRLVQCGFRQIDAFLQSPKELLDDDQIDYLYHHNPGYLADVHALRHTLGRSYGYLSAQVGQDLFRRAWRIESFHQSRGVRLYSFEEVQAHAQKYHFNRYVKPLESADHPPSPSPANRKPVYRRCTKANVLQAYACLGQVQSSLSRSSDRLPEVKAFLKQRQAYYTVPGFSDTNYLETDGMKEEGEQAIDASEHLSRRLRSLHLTLAAVNRLRRHTFLINATTLRLIQCGFRQIDNLLSHDHEPPSENELLDLQSLLWAGRHALSNAVGDHRFEKASAIEHFNPFGNRTFYTFEDILSDA